MKNKFILTDPLIFIKSTNKYLNSLYANMLIDDFTETSIIDNLINLEDSKPFDIDTLSTLIPDLLYTLIAHGTAYFELSQYNSTEKNNYTFHFIHSRIHFFGTNYFYFLGKNQLDGTQLYRVRKTKIRKIKLNEFGISNHTRKKIFRDLYKLSQTHNLLFNELLHNNEFTKYSSKENFLLLKYTKRIQWNIRGISNPITGQNLSYAIYQELNFRLLKLEIYLKFIALLNILFSENNIDIQLNTEKINKSLILYTKKLDLFIHNKINSSEITSFLYNIENN